MTQYNMLSVKLSNSQLSLKSGIKHGTEVTLNLSSNLINSYTSSKICNDS